MFPTPLGQMRPPLGGQNERSLRTHKVKVHADLTTRWGGGPRPGLSTDLTRQDGRPVAAGEKEARCEKEQKLKGPMGGETSAFGENPTKTLLRCNLTKPPRSELEGGQKKERSKAPKFTKKGDRRGKRPEGQSQS